MVKKNTKIIIAIIIFVVGLFFVGSIVNFIGGGAIYPFKGFGTHPSSVSEVMNFEDGTFIIDSMIVKLERFDSLTSTLFLTIGILSYIIIWLFIVYFWILKK